MRYLLVLLILLIAIPCYAGVEANILAHDIDENGNIRVKTQYILDGVEVESRYPKLNGKSYWVTRYNATTLTGLTEQETQDYIKSHIIHHGKAIIKKEFIRRENSQIRNQKLLGLTGTKIQINSAEMSRDTDGDGLYDKIFTVKSDGTKTSRVITPVAIPPEQ